MPIDDITGAQCRAARSLLGWKSKDLAERAIVGINTVTRFEAGEPSKGLTIKRIRQALEAAGIDFIEGGARIKPTGERNG